MNKNALCRATLCGSAVLIMACGGSDADEIPDADTGEPDAGATAQVDAGAVEPSPEGPVEVEGSFERDDEATIDFSSGAAFTDSEGRGPFGNEEGQALTIFFTSWEAPHCDLDDIDDIDSLAPEGTFYLASCKLNDDNVQGEDRYELQVFEGEKGDNQTNFNQVDAPTGCVVTLTAGGVEGGEQVEGSIDFFAGEDRDEPRGSASFTLNHCGEHSSFFF